jgi:O-antigen/teichoic acid export membrane protein
MLPALAGAAGFVASRCVFSLSRFLFRAPGVPIKASGRGSIAEVKDLMATGVPLLIGGVLYVYLGAADRSVIACLMRPADLGRYSLTALVMTGSQIVPFCLSFLFYPRIAECYGRTDSPRALRRYFWIVLGLSAAVVLPMCIGMYYTVGPLTVRYLPKYVDGIPAARIGCLSSVTFVYLGVSDIIAVVRRNALYNLTVGVALAVTWLLGTYLVTHGYGIVGAIWARSLGMGILCAFTIAYAYRLTTAQSLK